MGPRLVVCPNCGAYVLSSDNICPRCDYPLNHPAPDPVGVADVEPSPEDTPVNGTTGPLQIVMPEADAVEVDRSLLPTTEQPAVPDDLHEAESAPDDLELELEDLDERVGSPVDGPPADGSAPDEADLELSLELDLDDEPAPAFASDQTAPNLAWVVEPGDLRPGEEPTLTQFSAVREDDDMMTQARIPAEPDDLAPYIVPPAPFSPPPDDIAEIAPPLVVTAPPPSYVQAPLPAYARPAYTPAYAPAYYAPPAYGYGPVVPLIAQRIQSYVNGGYHLRSQNPRQAVLSYGKRLGVGTWLIALVSISGVLWYALLLVLSGFRQDRAYLDMAPDGRLYEDGPGAAHVRASRARSGRRWGLLGMILFLLSLVLLIGLILTAALMLGQDRYQAALRKAYPEVTYFENHFSDEDAAPDDVDLMKTGAVAYSILAGIAVVGVWGGFTLWVIGQVHASAYRVHVPPLPGYE